MSNQILPYVFAASFRAFQCCGCTTFSAKEVTELEHLGDYLGVFEVEDIADMMGERPLHYAVYRCKADDCDHMACEEHLVDGYCSGCWIEHRPDLLSDCVEQ